MSVVLQTTPESIRSRVALSCVPSGQLICQTTMPLGKGARNQIQFSHGFHLFLLNTALLVAARPGEEPSKPGAISLQEAQTLFRDQLTFFWERTPPTALMFPYHRFDAETHLVAIEITMLMTAFLMGHEMAHSFMPLENCAAFKDAEDASHEILNAIPHPFLDASAEWKKPWALELQCDALSTMALLLCDQNYAPPAGIPRIGDFPQTQRYVAVEAAMYHMESLLWTNTLRGATAALLTLYSRTHPLPNIRRFFIRGYAQQVGLDYLEPPKAYERRLRSLAPLPERLIMHS